MDTIQIPRARGYRLWVNKHDGSIQMHIARGNAYELLNLTDHEAGLIAVNLANRVRVGDGVVQPDERGWFYFSSRNITCPIVAFLPALPGCRAGVRG